jgi:quinolinate synthase
MVGDSFALARRAAETDAEVIVLCGVSFMAETAKILSPNKPVLLPDEHAGCPLADSAPYDEFVQYRKEHPGHLSITYINSSTEVKAASDIVCTSSSARKIVERIPEDIPLLFAPDENLGTYLMNKLHRDMITWPGGCIVHLRFEPDTILRLKRQHPDALIAAHPECDAAVQEIADFVGSTSGILKFTQESPASSFIVATEPGIIHQMQKANPDKEYIPAPGQHMHRGSICMNMKKNTLEKLHTCMKNRTPQIRIDESVRKNALRPIERMLELTTGDPAKSKAIIEEIQLPFDGKSLN